MSIDEEKLIPDEDDENVGMQPQKKKKEKKRKSKEERKADRKVVFWFFVILIVITGLFYLYPVILGGSPRIKNPKVGDPVNEADNKILPEWKGYTEVKF